MRRLLQQVSLVALLAGRLAAADADGTLTLDQALGEAARTATGPEIARARLEQVRALQTQARALLLPTLAANGSYTADWRSRAPYRGSSDETLAGEAGLSIRLFDATAFPALDAAKVQYASQEAASRDLRRATAFGVSSAYLTVLTAERLLSAAERRLVVANQLLDEAKARLKAGLAITSDVTRAEVEVAASQLAITQAKRGISVGRLALQEAMGGREPAVLATPTVVSLDDRPIDELLDHARQHRDDLSAARLTADANRYQVEVIRRANWPVFGASAGVRDQDTTGRLAGTTGDPDWYAGVNATWTIWDGGLRAGRVEQQEAVGRELQVNRRIVELQANRQVRSAVIDIQATAIAVVQAEALSRSAAADAADALARYRAGTTTATDLADAQLRSAQADADLEQRRIDVLSSRLVLRQAVGSWPLSDGEP